MHFKYTPKNPPRLGDGECRSLRVSMSLLLRKSFLHKCSRSWARAKFLLITVALLQFSMGTRVSDASDYRLAIFSADVTIPLNHRCMGVLPTKSKKIVDPLYAHGFVLLGAGKPIVFCAVDWCEIRNGAYDQWRESLGAAAGTSRERVLVSSLHQHDAPVTDSDAAELLEDVGLKGELYDEKFHNETVARVALALKDSLSEAVPVTHLGLGEAAVKRIASNRRVVRDDGGVSFGRGSSSGRNPFYADAPVGLIDSMLKTISFWNGEQAVLAMHSYATHPMSYYGRGGVTSDFVGLAREQRQRDDFSVKQIYFSGCSGDVTAGKYNNGSHDHRLELKERLYEGMVAAWQTTEKVALKEISFRNTPLTLDYYQHENLKRGRLETTLNDESATVEQRILAAMGLASRNRVEKRQQPIDFPCVDLGAAQIVLFPGEAFVGFQLIAQEMRADSFVFSIGYGECWTGYIPTNAVFADKFHDSWLWVNAGAENRIRGALERVLMTNSRTP